MIGHIQDQITSNLKIAEPIPMWIITLKTNFLIFEANINAVFKKKNKKDTFKGGKINYPDGLCHSHPET